jgi:hypothetical protein
VSPTLAQKQQGMKLRQRPRPGPLPYAGAFDPVAEGRARLHLYTLWQRFDGNMHRVSRITARPVHWLNEWRDRGFPLS